MLTALNSEEKTLPERAADKIIDMIVENALKPGDRLPTELELLQYLNVGRSTVREAIKLLVSQNIIEVRRGSGTFVREQTGVMDDPLGFRFVQDKLKLGLDLCEIRIMIEPDMAALAAERATREDLEQLREACLKVEELILQGKDYAQWDIRFHTVLAQCTGNSVVHALVPIFTQAVPFFIDITRKGLLKQTIDSHRDILEAVCAGDGQSAAQAMLHHLENNRRNMLDISAKLAKRR